jgi:hypothetical protein
MSAPTDEAFFARTRSEGPLSALHVEMCMAQHLLLPAQSRIRPHAGAGVAPHQQVIHYLAVM